MQTGGGNINIRVSKARSHEFLFREWTLMYHKWESAGLYAVTMQDRKDMGGKNIQPKIYGDVKIETKWGEEVYHDL